MNIAVITSGGDSPGMNPCVAQIVKEASQSGHQVFGFERGYLGIRDQLYRRLTPKDVQDWYQLGGTQLRSGRFPELSERSWQERLVQNLQASSMDALIVIGGDGSFQGAMRLHEADLSLSVIGIPGTIDNNIYGSSYTLGFDTALNTQVKYLDGIADTAMSIPGRVFFVETLGAWDGYLTNSSVLMGMADFSVLVEKPMSNAEICTRVEQVLADGQRDYCLVTFAEGSYQTLEAAEYVRTHLGANVKCNLMGFTQRGGKPSALDRLHAAGFAHYALQLLEAGKTNLYVVYAKGAYDYLPITEASKKKTFDWMQL